MMERSGTTSPIPSTSAENAPENHTVNDDPVFKEKEETFTAKSLDVICKIAGALKTDTDSFVEILETFLALFEGNRNDERQLKYGLLEEVMWSIREADSDELSSAKEYFEGILTPKIETVLIKDVDIEPFLKGPSGRLNVVYLGTLRQPNGSWKQVVLKRAIKSENAKFIEHESKIMSQLNHKNIVKFYGKCEDKPEIVLEFMDYFDFTTVLQNVTFTTGNLMRFLEDVACGMEYLAEKQIVHRNLTCLSIFVNKKKQCKIGNFTFAVYVGDSDGVYVDKDCCIRPVETEALFLCGGCCSINFSYLAPETIDTKTFSQSTDVWCMGFLCWDMFDLADPSTDIPQQGVTRKNFLLKNIELPKLKKCPNVLHQYVVNHLLVRDPKERPNFTGIRTKINEIASSMSV